MMPPWPRSVIAPSAAWERRSTAVTSTCSIATSSSTGLSRKRFLRPKPALLTSRSTGRSRSATRCLDPGQVVGVDQVGPQHLDLDAVGGPELGGHGLQPGLVAGHQHQVVALAGELAGELQPDPGGGAGDERRRTGGRGRAGRGAVGAVAEIMRPAFRCRRDRGNRVGHDGQR